MLGALGEGTFGVVYRARNLDTGNEVALKVLKVAPGTRRLERFRREGAIAAGLRHPGIVALLASGTTRGRPYLEFELVLGANSLRDVLVHAGQRRLLEILRDAARALGHAHKSGVLHRDVKPGNILVDLAGQVRVTDFGVATAKGFESLTRTGELVGTPLYMAPEQVEGRRDDYSPATDVWALGVILYEILAKRLPYQADNFIQLLDAVRGGRVEPPSAHSPGVDAALESICLRALKAEPSQRYATGADLAEELTAYLNTNSSGPPPRRAQGVRLAAFASALLGLGVLLGASVVVGGGLGAEPSRPHSAAGLPRPISTSPAAASGELEAGRGVVADSARTEELLRASAELDDLESMERLGCLLQEDPKASEARLAESIQWLRRAAKGRRSGAMVALAKALRVGRGVERNPAAAQAWAEKAAQAGDSAGMNALGDLLVWGREPSLKEGFAWLQRSASSGDARGIALVGACYAEGKGVEQDDSLALDYYARAVAEGDGYAMNRLGFAYQFGKLGLARDVDKALDLYRKSAQAGYGEGMANLGYMVMKGWGVAEDPQEAASWFRRAVEAGSSQGMVFLGFMYGKGSGVEQDHLRAKDLYERAADAGNARAMHNLGAVYRYGYGGGQRDPSLAFEWYRRAAIAGDSEGALALGDYYRAGDFLPKDDVEARRWYRVAHTGGSRAASLKLAAMLFAGEGGARDPAEARRLVEVSARQGSPEGARVLGEIYLTGDGVPKDPRLAEWWLRQAALRGNERAKSLLKKHFE